MPRPTNTDERRAQIVAGLQAAMATRGYERATIAEIAQAAGLTPGLVHYHFENKQEILLALMQKLAGVWRERANARVERRDDPRARLGRLLDAWLALDKQADAEAVACWVTLGAEAVRQPAVRELYLAAVRESAAALQNAVRDVLENEARSPDGSAAIAAGLTAAIEGYLLLGTLGDGIVPRASAAATLRAMADGALDAQPAATRAGGRRRDRS